MSVDLGSENLKVALVMAGKVPIQIVTNEMTKRKTASLVGFIQGDRVLGEEATSLITRYPDKIYMLMRDFLGKRADDPAVQKLLADNYLPYQVVADQDRGSILIRTDQGKEHAVEELVGSILYYAKRIAEAQAGTQIRDAVLVVPAFFGQEQRAALKQAAKLAGLEVMTLLNSHAGAALQYGITRDFSEQNENVILYDIGYDSVEAALVHYSTYTVKKETQNQVEVKDVVWIDDLGGRDMDNVLMQYFAAEFREKYGSDDILTHPKAVAKLRKQVKRTKEILSANQDAPFNVEELYDDRDFSSSITRQKFEELIAPIVQRIKEPLEQLLQRNKLKIDDIAAVEMIGGASRVPVVQQALQDVLQGRGLDKHLDADEAVVLGAGLVAANLSSTFRLRKFGMTDGATYPISVKLISPETLKQEEDETVFEPKTLLPFMKKLESKRALSFTNLTTDPIEVSLSYEEVSNLPPGVASPEIVVYTVSGLSTIQQQHGYTGKVAFHFLADTSGVIQLNKADATVNVTEIQTKMVPVNETEQSSDDHSATDTQDEQSVQDNNTQDGEENTTEQPKVKMEKVEYEVTKPVKIALNITKVQYSFSRISDEEIQSSIRKLQSMQQQEEEKRADAQAKNELESYIYEIRDKLSDEEGTFYKVSTAEWRDNFSSKLMEMEDWLMFEGEGESAAQYKDKLKLLRKESDPVQRRVFEFEHRERAVEDLKMTISQIKISVLAWPDIKPYINQTDIDDLVKQADQVQEWLEAKLKEQESIPLTENPAFKVQDLISKGTQLTKQFNKLNSKKAPRLPPSTKSQNVTSEDDSNKTVTDEDTQHEQEAIKEAETKQEVKEEL